MIKFSSYINCVLFFEILILLLFYYFSPNLFSPTLPQYKVNCIENLGFGIVDKIFLRFETKWWLPDWTGIALLWTAEDRDAILKKVCY